MFTFTFTLQTEHSCLLFYSPEGALEHPVRHAGYAYEFKQSCKFDSKTNNNNNVKIWPKLTHPLQKRRFLFARSASAVTPSKKCAINVNRKSTTIFPMSLI